MDYNPLAEEDETSAFGEVSDLNTNTTNNPHSTPATSAPPSASQAEIKTESAATPAPASAHIPAAAELKREAVAPDTPAPAAASANHEHGPSPATALTGDDAAEANDADEETNEEEKMDESVADDGAGEEDGEEEDGDYAAEYRSLLYRVADMQTQEEQRGWQQGFALRMAQREAQLMSRVVRQQQVYLATRHAAPSSSPETPQENFLGTTPSALTSSEAVAAAMSRDARLLCYAYRTEQAQQHKRRLTEATALLRSHAQTVQREREEREKLQETMAEVLAALYAESGVESPSAYVKGSNGAEVRPLLPPPPPPPTSAAVVAGGSAASSASSASLEKWQEHASSLSTLGGTLAKVYTLFEDPACRTSMSAVASQLTQLGRQSQQLLLAMRRLTTKEGDLEADLRHRRHVGLQWAVYAAHVQQARELADLYSPATVAEMRAMAVRKLLLRRRQELQDALTVAVAHDAENSLSDGSSLLHARAPKSGAESMLSVPFSSPAADVTTETMKAAVDDCARRETLRERLWRELLFLKKCIRRELGVEWMAPVEAAALRTTAAATQTADARALSHALASNLCRHTYENLARVLRAGPLQTSQSADTWEDEESALVSTPLSPSAALAPRVRVLALLESVQTRANSLTSLLVENAKHWQRVCDARVEAEVGSRPQDPTWARAADVLLRRCSVEVNEGDNAGEDEGFRQSALLDAEQQLLNVVQTAQTALLADVNAALAQLHAQGVVPLQQVKREVLVLLRLLQLSDEVLLEKQREDLEKNTWCAQAHSAPALEDVVQVLSAEAGVASSTSSPPQDTDAFSSLLDVEDSAASQTSSYCQLPHLSIPQLPRTTEEVQVAMRGVSDVWRGDVHADTDSLRSGVASKQASLEQYAQYSMAEVPSLLEKTRAEVKTLKVKLAEHAQQSSRAAALSAHVTEQQQLLHQRTTTEREALHATLQEVRGANAALEAEVVFLRAWSALAAAEDGDRQAVCVEETAAWSGLVAEAKRIVLDYVAASAVKQENFEVDSARKLSGEGVPTDSAAGSPVKVEGQAGVADLLNNAFIAEDGEDAPTHAYDDHEAEYAGESAQEQNAASSSELYATQDADVDADNTYMGDTEDPAEENGEEEEGEDEEVAEEEEGDAEMDQEVAEEPQQLADAQEAWPPAEDDGLGETTALSDPQQELPAVESDNEEVMTATGNEQNRDNNEPEEGEGEEEDEKEPQSPLDGGASPADEERDPLLDADPEQQAPPPPLPPLPQHQLGQAGEEEEEVPREFEEAEDANEKNEQQQPEEEEDEEEKADELAKTAAEEEKEEEVEETPLPPALSSGDVVEAQQQDEEAAPLEQHEDQPEEDDEGGQSGVLGTDGTSVVGGGVLDQVSSQLPPVLDLGNGAGAAPLPPVFPAPPNTSSNAVLDDNPFYSGYLFED